MSFPEHELESIRKRLSQGKSICTTRISVERGAYNLGDVVETPIGLLKVTMRTEMDDAWLDHPFQEELAIGLIRVLKGQPGDLLELQGI